MKPNLFLIGAPKCGTSSLFDWLSRHPQVRGSHVKEPFFLIDPQHPLARRPSLAADGLQAYASLFHPEDAQAAFRMEATTHYVFDRYARDAIAQLPGAHVVLVLREPAMRIYSSFQYTANNLARLRPGLTFSRYLELVKAGHSLMPEWCTHPGSAHVLQNDLLYSRYHLHVAPWMTVLPAGRLRILVMEEMVRDPEATVSDLLTWLGLDLDLMLPFDGTARNRTESVRSRGTQAVVRSINARIRPPEKIRSVLKRAYAALQFQAPQGMSADDRQSLEQLRASYVEDNARLAEMTGLNLSKWAARDVGKTSPLELVQ